MMDQNKKAAEEFFKLYFELFGFPSDALAHTQMYEPIQGAASNDGYVHKMEEQTFIEYLTSRATGATLRGIVKNITSVVTAPIQFNGKIVNLMSFEQDGATIVG